MKKQILIIVILFLGANTIFSQENDIELQKQFKIDFNFMGSGVSYEIPLAKKWTVDLSIGIGGGSTSGNDFVWILNSSPALYLKSEFKYIYNRDKRRGKVKNNTLETILLFKQNILQNDSLKTKEKLLYITLY